VVAARISLIISAGLGVGEPEGMWSCSLRLSLMTAQHVVAMTWQREQKSGSLDGSRTSV
jgi:hypothetical protein